MDTDIGPEDVVVVEGSTAKWDLEALGEMYKKEEREGKEYKREEENSCEFVPHVD